MGGRENLCASRGRVLQVEPTRAPDDFLHALPNLVTTSRLPSSLYYTTRSIFFYFFFCLTIFVRVLFIHLVGPRVLDISFVSRPIAGRAQRMMQKCHTAMMPILFLFLFFSFPNHVTQPKYDGPWSDQERRATYESVSHRHHPSCVVMERSCTDDWAAVEEATTFSWGDME